MSIDQLFRRRIGLEAAKRILFSELEDILIKAARTFPFENLCIIKGKIKPISVNNLTEKLLVRNEGGLCYELNPLLFLFLKENGFNVSLIRGAVYNQTTKEWSATGRTHVAILLEHEGEKYLVDTGFGGNIPLAPVPLSGESVTSANGEFRVRKMESPFGDYWFEMKRKGKDKDWVIGFAFDSTVLIHNVSELEEMQTIIVESVASSFNKEALVTMLTEEGSMTLTKKSFTSWQDGKLSKEEIDEPQFSSLVKRHFGLQW